jgi:hypothetical protein
MLRVRRKAGDQSPHGEASRHQPVPRYSWTREVP